METNEIGLSVHSTIPVTLCDIHFYNRGGVACLLVSSKLEN
jgi:hypothetical protein